jgi:hypothetical protein
MNRYKQNHIIFASTYLILFDRIPGSCTLLASLEYVTATPSKQIPFSLGATIVHIPLVFQDNMKSLSNDSFDILEVLYNQILV